MEYAYARVSSCDQNLARQTTDFKNFGISEKHIFADKISGKDFERLAYKKLLRKLKRGDLLVIKSIDRLGRNYDAIIEQWSRITNTIGADILVIDMPILDTRAKHDSLVGKFISDIVLQVLSFVAENERDNIKSRQSEGIRLARLRGVKFGRPKKIHSELFINTVRRYRENNLSLGEALNLLDIKKSNFFYHMKHIAVSEKMSALSARG